MITDLYRKEDEGDKIHFSPEETEKALAVAKRVFTEEVMGTVFIFEKTQRTPTTHNMSGMAFSNEMDKVEMLKAVLKVLNLPTEAVKHIAEDLEADHQEDEYGY